MFPTRFHEASVQLLQAARERIRAGETSERSLARLAGLSQPHMHNVLMGKRGLQPSVADRLLDILGLSLGELGSGERPPPSDIGVPWLAGPVGGGRVFPGTSTQPPARFFDRNRLPRMESSFLCRIAPEEVAMLPTLSPGDDVLLDCSWRARARPRRQSIYVIEWQGLSYVCRCYAASGALVTLIESQTSIPPPPRVSLDGRKVQDVIRAEIVWYGRALARS